MDKPLFELDLDISEYYLSALNDIVRIVIMQIVVQILFTLRNPSISLFDSIFVENTIFIVIGLSVYWLIFNQLVKFKSNDDGNDDSTSDGQRV